MGVGFVVDFLVDLGDLLDEVVVVVFVLIVFVDFVVFVVVDFLGRRVFVLVLFGDLC